jgi:hypothetical protein
MGAAHRMIQKDQPMQALKGRDTKAMGAAHRLIQKDQPMQALKGRDTFHAKSDTLSRFITPSQG